MFNNKSRPFYQSSTLHELRPLPLDELAAYLVERFTSAGRVCPAPAAQILAALSLGHPHYAQKMASSIFDMAGKTITEADARQAADYILQEQEPLFGAQLQALTLIQIKFLEALATEPTKAPFSSAFLGKLDMSLASVQN